MGEGAILAAHPDLIDLWVATSRDPVAFVGTADHSFTIRVTAKAATTPESSTVCTGRSSRNHRLPLRG
jgi:hypothetical protein